MVALSLFKTSSLDSEKKKEKILLCFSEQALSAVSVTDISTLTVSQKKIKPKLCKKPEEYLLWQELSSSSFWFVLLKPKFQNTKIEINLQM